MKELKQYLHWTWIERADAHLENRKDEIAQLIEKAEESKPVTDVKAASAPFSWTGANWRWYVQNR